MSHVVTIATEIRDPIALRRSCQRLGLAEPVHRTTKLFSSEATGYCVELPDWRYPVVCQIETGTVLYDNYNGKWGDQVHLDRLKQAYAVEKSVFESRRQGHSVTEQTLADGTIKLTIQLGGEA
ncbi:DUF1257 domain-containing protein [Stieleria sp. JC731]|uniref:DUF1257 domain-containing protein n=1 Tax=Pirellulaceae TaxID=2691357 RepID=UPI001E51130E|nr:DUF1257 domain-containing protein [Stieleria sp. JC731]MCC9601043.1 DUF1257 domain-containing protein [Stieleria sp. JC731]